MLRIVLAHGGEQRVHLGLDVGDRRLQVRPQREGAVLADLQHALESRGRNALRSVCLIGRATATTSSSMELGSSENGTFTTTVRGDVDRAAWRC